MANDRNRLEQEALLHLNKGSLDGALNAYLQILKQDPKDRRLRQKVGELYLKLNRPQDAVKHLREVADGLVKEGNHRPAIAILKQIIAVIPDDPALQMDMGECYLASGYPNDARTAFDLAMRLYINLLNPGAAAKAARKVADLSPGEPALKLRVAELLEQTKDPTPALGVYQEVMAEYRRRGRPDEVGRVAELALRLKPDDMGLVLDAAAARVEGQEWKKAVAHLQPAFKQAPNDPRVLDLLARTFEGLEQPDRALKVLLELARVAAERKDAAAETDALRRAVKLGMEEGDVRTRLTIAEAKLARAERRLSALALYQPATEELLRVQARTETLARYGFADRAEGELNAALLADPEAPPLIAAYAEILAGMGRIEEAISWMQKLLPTAGTEKAQVLDRIAVLQGEEEAPTAQVEELVDDEAEDVVDEEIIDDEDEEEVTNPRIGIATKEPTAEERGDLAAEKGDFAGALVAWREVLAEDPSNERVLQKIASLRTRAREQAEKKEAPKPPPPPAPPPPAPPAVAKSPPPPSARAPAAEDEDVFARLLEEGGTLTEIEPEALPSSEEDNLEEARSLVAVGMFQQGLDLVKPLPSLGARVVEAQALRGLGKIGEAVEVMREASNEASEDDPAYADALFELSGLYTATGKHKSALRLLEELADLFPDYRSQDVAARSKGLQKLLGGR